MFLLGRLRMLGAQVDGWASTTTYRHCFRHSVTLYIIARDQGHNIRYGAWRGCVGVN